MATSFTDGEVAALPCDDIRYKAGPHTTHGTATDAVLAAERIAETTARASALPPSDANNATSESDLSEERSLFSDTITTRDGHKYSGQLKDAFGQQALMHGKGVMHYTNSDSYDGEWRNGAREGMGVMRYADGAVYEGEWAANMPNGCGSMTLGNGDAYEGAFVGGMKQGMGTETIKSTGERYVGSFRRDMREGRGFLELRDGVQYEGTFRDSIIHGEGTMTFPNADAYSGSFEGGLMHGKGVYVFANGDRYEGTYTSGRRVGGRLVQRDGKEYTAEFKPSGELAKLKSHAEDGIEVLHDSRRVSASGGLEEAWKEGAGSILYPNGDRYTGEFHNHKRHGIGVMQHSNGDQFEGSWKDDKRHGKGRMTWQDQAPDPIGGWRYDGEWRGDLPDGHGVLLMDLNGSKYEGSWVKGRRSGLGIQIQDGCTYTGEWCDNLMNGRGKLAKADSSLFNGHFKDGALHDSNAKIVFSNGDVYCGDVQHGVLCGEGVLSCKNGDSYEGEFSEDTRCGSGMLAFANGDLYEGRWQADKMHGHGVLTYHGNGCYEGSFKENKKHGRGMLRAFVTRAHVTQQDVGQISRRMRSTLSFLRKMNLCPRRR